MKDVIIIGGGPAGILCAAAIKENAKEMVNVTIVERLEKIGKKILATGNGKCNFTNKNLSPRRYNNPKFVTPTLSKYGYKEIVEYLESIGLLSKEISEGRMYPYTESATTVLEVMRMHLNRLGVNVKTNYEVNKVVEKNGRYLVYNKNQRNYYLECDYLVFACGGASAPVLGSNGSGYGLLKPFKVKVTDIYPGLVGIKSDITTLKVLNGLRFKCNVSVYEKKTKSCVWIEYGEVQFKGDGISGIVVMEASTFMARHLGNYVINLDLMPEASLDDTIRMLNIRKELFESNEVLNLLTGMLPKMLGQVILKKASIDMNSYIKNLTKANITKIAGLIKAFPLDVKGDYGFERSQVTVGGVSLTEVDNETLEIRKMPNAYVCGEIIDVDGECGGYNMQWALASGYLVGKKISESINENA
jgi:predicted Rossmann fold flavoprotein